MCTPYIERALCSYIGECERELIRAHTWMHYEGVVEKNTTHSMCVQITCSGGQLEGMRLTCRAASSAFRRMLELP